MQRTPLCTLRSFLPGHFIVDLAQRLAPGLCRCIDCNAKRKECIHALQQYTQRLPATCMHTHQRAMAAWYDHTWPQCLMCGALANNKLASSLSRLSCHSVALEGCVPAEHVQSLAALCLSRPMREREAPPKSTHSHTFEVSFSFFSPSSSTPAGLESAICANNAVARTCGNRSIQTRRATAAHGGRKSATSMYGNGVATSFSRSAARRVASLSVAYWKESKLC